MAAYTDLYYYADNNNYTETYLEETGLTQRVALCMGIFYCIFAGITLIIYSRLLTVRN
jgi:hypothetical protein